MPPITPTNPKTTITLDEELKRITQEMYKKNFELSEKNKMLSLLREIDEIILSSVTDIQEIAQQVCNLIVKETEFKVAAILIYDKEKNELVRLAVSQTKQITDIELRYNRILFGAKTSLELLNNPIVAAVREKSMQVTEDLSNMISPNFPVEDARVIQNTLAIGLSFIYPLVVRQEVIGTIVMSLGVRESSVSIHQKELMERLAEMIGIALDNSILYQQIQKANLKLKDLDKLKDEFVSLASHELRTPMTIIKSYIWMLLQMKEGILNNKQKMYLERTYLSVDRLIKLVNDMLNVSRIESGRISLELKPGNLSKIAREVVMEMQPKAQELGTIMSVIDKNPIPDTQIDTERIKQVLINLIGNALKFTPSNGLIKIELEQKGDEVVAHVIDNGKGINAEDLPKLFQKFGTITKDYLKRQNPQGTGLGLYISKSLVELHGGKVWGKSEGENKGSIFSFSIKIR